MNRDTACAKCHTPGLYGTHPRHYGGGNCGAICHSGFGPSNLFAVPGWVGVEGSFASSASLDASASYIHIVHSQKTWIGSASKPSEKCVSCHGVADCATCHEYLSVSGYHQQHSATGDASWTAQAPWTGVTSHGVIGGDLTMATDWSVSNQCATAGCHNVDRMRASAPVLRETNNHPITPQTPYSENITVSPGPWLGVSGQTYTGGYTIYTNKTGYTVSNTFPGQLIEVVTDLDPYRGIAQIFIDGVLKATVDCYAPTTSYQKIVYRSETLGAGDHTVTVRVTGTKNPLSRGAWIFADGFRVYSTVLDYAAPKCLSCHPGQDSSHGYTYSHVVDAATWTSGTYSGYACSSCHTPNMPDEHRRASSKVASANCNACHTVYAPKVYPSGQIGCTQTGLTAPGCHQAANGQAPHNFGDTNHNVSTQSTEAKCRACHAGALDVIHNNSITTNAVTTNCLSCHGVNKFPATKDCTGGCHIVTGVDSMETHPYPADAHAGSGVDAGVSNTGGYACSQCHNANLDLSAEHARTSSLKTDNSAITCSTCHDLSYLPRPWSGTCVTCHTGGAQAPLPHGAFSTKHDYSVYSATNTSSCGGLSCHDVTRADLIHNNNAADGRNGTCASCHVSGATSVPTQHLCTDCHTAHNLATPHQSGAYAASTQCLRCHEGFGDINTAHPSCATCHQNAILVDYLQDHYTPACTDCHNSGAGKLGKVYTPTDPAHYTGSETTHTANAGQASSLYDYDGAGTEYVGRRCDACHNMEMKPEHITKSYTYFAGVPATYPDKCVACHQQKVDGLTGGWNHTCDACHATKHTGVSTAHNAATTILVSKVGSPTAGTACGTAGCHDVTNIQAIHNNSVTSNDASGAAYVTTCLNTCHSSNSVQAKKACDAVGCHFGMVDHNADHAPASNNQCAACHESADVKTVHGGASNCAVCHANPVYPGITTTNTTSCGDGACHNATGIGGKSYALPDGHYAGEETSHASTGNGTYNGYSCSQCHLLDLKTEHSKSSVAYVTGSYAGTTTVIGKCVGCHELKVDNFVVAWDKKCATCHPTTHADRTTKHNASVLNPGCGPSKVAGCHDINDVALIHNNSITTNSMFPSCVTCHSSNTAVPNPIDCDAVGCHAGMTHSHSLNLVGSNYNNTTVTGCTNSGIGCHGSMVTSPTPDYAISQYHPRAASLCTSSRCHRNASNTATNTTQQDPAFNNPQTCQNCHGGRTVAPLLYDGAPKVTSLASATPNGHYNETTHTIVSVVQTMSVGGASYTTCVTCHQHTNPNGIDGEWYQHQALQLYGNTTCYDCHSFVTPGDVAGTSRVGSLITTSVANGRHLDCKDCHNVLVMGTNYVIHETTSSPPATATVMSTPTFNCADVGCHAATGLEIHELHKGDGKIIPYQMWDGSQYTTYTATRCNTLCHNYTAPYTMSNLTTTTECERRPEPQCVDCHDPLLQGWKPTAKTCGVNGACHITSPHSQMGPAHSVTALSAACIECHETTDLRGNHGYASDETCGGVGDNNICHNLVGVQYWSGVATETFTLVGKKECADCHALGKMPNVKRNHAPHDPNHYLGSEATHTAINQTGTFGKIYSVIATESFTGGATWPTAWTRSSVVTVTSSSSAPTYGQILNSNATLRYAYFQRTVDTANISSPTVSFTYTTGSFAGGDDNAKLEYSTDGVNFTTAWSTTAAQGTWTAVGPLAISRATTVTVRFSANTNSSSWFRVDDIVIKPGDAVGAGCFLTCHYNEMKPEHFKPTAEATRVPGIYSDKCIDCHENRVDAFDVTKGIDWDRTCVQCHGDEKHYGQTAKHDASLVKPECGGSGCHYLKDVAVIHNNSSLGNTWPADPAQSCTVCHSSKDHAPQPPVGYESYSALDCGLPGCHEGTVAHNHELDYDGSLFNAGATPADMTGCVQSGAGCHGNLTTTNYATGYHASVGCLNGNCHNANATNHNDPQFNDPNTCMNCHGGGALLYSGATNRIPIAGATPNGHYPETTHTAAAGSRTTSVTGAAGGTISARCNQCHNDVNPSGSDGLYYQHTAVTIGGVTSNVTCVACHNYSVGVSAVVTGNWTTDSCTDCHNVTLLPSDVAHSASIAPTVTATEYSGGVATPGACVTTGCHATTNLHALHKGTASTPSTRTALGCAFSGCHDYTKQGKKPTLKSCGVGGACHTYDAHNPAAHAISVDTGNCTRCHEGSGGTAATDIRTVYKSANFGDVQAHAACSTCHNGTLVLPAGTDCISCHNGTKVGTHAYSAYDPNHYYTASHDASVSTTRNWGTTNYGATLSDYHGNTLSYERGCTTCHTIDLRTEHEKTSVSFNLSGKADKCVACHELKVDNWSARWTGSCAGEANSCHNDAALHDQWATKHDASAAVMTTPGVSFVAGSADTSTQEFLTTPLPVDGWTTTDTVKVKITTTDTAGSGYSVLWVPNATTLGYNIQKNYSTVGYTSAKITFKYKRNGSSTTDYIALWYSTNGTTWTQLVRFTANATTWTQAASYDLPISGTLRVRFQGFCNAAAEYNKIDDIQVTLSNPSGFGSQLAAGSTAAQSCMNNPNGTNCHDVTDVADIHSRTANNGCPICHTSTAQNPTSVTCQDTGCHVGINLNSHNTAWHESTFGSTSSGIFSGSGIATAWCRGCHDDSIDNEHFVLTPYAASPCSMCHKKSTDSGAPTNVTSANTSATIHGDSVANNALCENCHGSTMGPGSRTTSGTAFGFHVQASGVTTQGSSSLATTAGIQWSPTWSGHRSFSSMPGQRTGFTVAVDGISTNINWSLVTATTFLKTGWQSSTQMVVCSDCHGDISGATGPHGSTMALGIAAGYINDYSTGALYNNAGNMSNTTTSLCSKCHATALGYNSAHSDSNHQGSSATKGACTACHIKIPHAWKRPRLIGYTTDPAPYATTGFTGISVKTRTPTGWSGSTDCNGCGEHSSTLSPKWP